ncbi:MAG: CBS domain-containing protein [Lachnospiraceae bacterium]|jgi:CBS domain-containing protein|nr:CBS domain-containing protein [Lachnospiraceae bacterium]
MNILLFIKPKATLAYVYDYHSVRQALEIMEYHRYSSIPIVTKDGFYAGCITEGDLLWALKGMGFPSIKETEEMNIMNIPRKGDYLAVSAAAQMSDIIERAMEQNFVPVVDDYNHFIGMITRKDIIGYLCKITKEEKAKEDKIETNV